MRGWTSWRCPRPPRKAVTIVSFVGFGLSLVAVYLSSSLYHLVARAELKQRLLRFDHAAIYLLIAGTYTPFTLLNLNGTWWGWSMFVGVWVLAAIGVVIKLFAIEKLTKVSTATYLGMGWLVLIAIKPAVAAISTVGLIWLLAGGVAYTVGVIFFVSDRIPYGHAIWHGFVVSGSACHAAAVLNHAGYAS
ncbi:MAG: hemolysin III family protein [Deltaproteobacteria bacterium]|nr:hemolysin III family protein [Deltaproteobacteria bacterium]